MRGPRPRQLTPGQWSGSQGGRGDFCFIYFYTGGLRYSRNFVIRKPNDILNLHLAKNDIKILTT